MSLAFVSWRDDNTQRNRPDSASVGRIYQAPPLEPAALRIGVHQLSSRIEFVLQLLCDRDDCFGRELIDRLSGVLIDEFDDFESRRGILLDCGIGALIALTKNAVYLFDGLRDFSR